ncbi:MAG: hypothetical protein GY864_10045 [Desulfobacterales bacterium]|nr:hypothetical protein [Desulfobacterales bacterium]
MSLNRIANVLKEKKSFLLMTHEHPDIDGIASILALGKALTNAKKDVIALTDEPIPSPINNLKGSDSIVREFDHDKKIDVVLILDCGETKRVGGDARYFEGHEMLINIDHHETNDFFGTINLVDEKSSSTGELVYKIITATGLRIDGDIAENIFAAIQADTGSFRYSNTTSECLKIAAEMVESRAKPWRISERMTGEYGLSRLKLLEMGLASIEFYQKGKISVMTISSEMFERAKADWMDSEKFVDFPRLVSGVEVAVLIRQAGENDYKFSLRSNKKVNVAGLAAKFGGGGHARAAGFEGKGPLTDVKKNFLKEAFRVLNGTPK